VDHFLAAVAEAEESRARLVVIRAEGRHFCAGFDFSDLDSHSDGDLALRFLRIGRMLQVLRQAPFCSVAVVNGAALGAGADLVAACSHRVGTRSAWFSFPGYRFGLALGTHRLRSLAGESGARAFLLRDTPISAEEALSRGLLTALIDETAIEGAIGDLDRVLRGFGPQAILDLLRNSSHHDVSAEEELGVLARSLIVPGIRDRIDRYRQTSGIRKSDPAGGT
jgi:enoyl-CoA hydratase/carnithine racemase